MADAAGTPNLSTISNAFTQARLNALAMPAFPGAVPATLEDAYRVQQMSVQKWPENPAGWKVAMIGPAFAERFGTNRLVGPVFPQFIVRTDGQKTVTMPVFVGGFTAVEAEFVFILGSAIPPGSAPTRKQLLSHISAMHIGIEMAGSPLAAINDHGPTCTICDFANNAGLIIGPEVKDWQQRSLASLQATVTIDGAQVGDAAATAIQGGPIAALEFLVVHCAAQGITLDAGTAITTGAVTGVHKCITGASAAADFGRDGRIDVTLTPAQPISF